MLALAVACLRLVCASLRSLFWVVWGCGFRATAIYDGLGVFWVLRLMRDAGLLKWVWVYCECLD